MKQKLIAFILCLFMLFGCASFPVFTEKEVPFKIINHLPKTVIVRIQWLNHPYGCSKDPWVGTLRCEFEPFVCEIDPDETFIWTMRGDYINEGNKYKIIVHERTWEGGKTLDVKHFIVPKDIKGFELNIYLKSKFDV